MLLAKNLDKIINDYQNHPLQAIMLGNSEIIINLYMRYQIFCLIKFLKPAANTEAIILKIFKLNLN